MCIYYVTVDLNLEVYNKDSSDNHEDNDDNNQDDNKRLLDKMWNYVSRIYHENKESVKKKQSKPPKVGIKIRSNKNIDVYDVMFNKKIFI